jgi:hypothetical protein
MALIRNIGAPVSIAAGATHYWEYWFGANAEVGVALVTPNILESSIKIHLVAADFGVMTVPGREEGGPGIHYTVSVRNTGTFAVTYNLNIGNLL